MKILYRLIATVSFLCSGFIACAQGSTSIQLDTLSKIIGLVGIGVGLLVGWMSLKNAAKLAELELKFNAALATHEEKMELKIDSRIKDVENKMATKHDINNLKQIMVLQHENVKEAQENLKEKINIALNRKHE